jgi:hypothetical protein
MAWISLSEFDQKAGTPCAASWDERGVASGGEVACNDLHFYQKT